MAAHVGAGVVLCTRSEIWDGAYTGEVLTTMIGEAKARAARELLSERGSGPEECHAYGEHVSDPGLLRHPVVAGEHPDLPAEAGLRGRHHLAGDRPGLTHTPPHRGTGGDVR
ncbi:MULTISPECIES: haloacid dehalogenase-like hydrolase [unclassified Streptomyces]|uniref:haloacid dehalogenase-like hydrolase n=1 Tax=unclassified Streptomyces TaxID=2593676 RepID=UPI0034335325